MEALDLKEIYLRGRISREDTSSRRRSKSFRSNIIISSIASSPGYALNEEIDPSTYSFTKALEALQAKNVHTWDEMSAEGIALNSKWSEAERYICNPLSGEVPVECLSARTLNSRSFRQLTRGITMSEYPLHLGQNQIKNSLSPIQQERRTCNMKMVVGIETASRKERFIRCKEEDFEEESPISIKNARFQEQGKRKEDIVKYEENKEGSNKQQIMCRWRSRQCGGLLPFWSFWMKRKQQHLHHNHTHPSRKKMFFFCHNV